MKSFDPCRVPAGFHPYNGFLNVYKEAGYTSMDVCAKLRGILHMKKIGHAGTLDPMAEGVLPVALGCATKEIDRIGDGTKTYRAGMLLGVVTDTQDSTGHVLAERDLSSACPSEEEVREAVFSFLGSYEQLTPMYSARKVNGKKLYEYARSGRDVERKRKTVEIADIRIESMELPHVVMTVTCSKGTYIRTLCHDIGEKLGVGACMESLVRTRAGGFSIEEAVTLSQIEKARDDGTVDTLLSVKTPTAVALGKFDGCHIGHRELFADVRRMAQEEHLRTLALLLNFGRELLEDPAERRRELYAEGFDYVIELPFSEALRSMRAADFVQDILCKRLSMRAIAAGEDLSFGYGREGNADVLRELSGTYDFRVSIIPKLRTPAKGTGELLTVSSSLVREAVLQGDMESTARLLGKPLAFTGDVVHGRHLGSTALGFPTVNIRVPEYRLLPPFGVYAVLVSFLPEGKERFAGNGKEPRIPVYEGIANLGKKPTLSGEPGYNPSAIELETNLFSYHSDAYGRRIRVELISFLRSERKFPDLAALSRQLTETDIPAAKKVLANFCPE